MRSYFCEQCTLPTEADNALQEDARMIQSIATEDGKASLHY